MKLTKFRIACILGILIIPLIAFIDIQGFNLLGEDYTNGLFPSNVWTHHLITSIILMLIPALAYFYLYRKDKSEALAVFSIPFIMFWFGACDVFYFWIQGKSIPLVLSHLNNHFIIGNISKYLGYSGGTNISLLVSVLIGIIFADIVVWILKEKF